MQQKLEQTIWNSMKSVSVLFVMYVQKTESSCQERLGNGKNKPYHELRSHLRALKEGFVLTAKKGKPAWKASSMI